MTRDQPPTPAQLWSDWFQPALHAHAEQDIIDVGGTGVVRQATFGELVTDVTAWVGALARAGVATGDAVGVAGPNGLDWVRADLALYALGARPVGLPLSELDGGPQASLERYHLHAIIVVGDHDGVYHGGIPVADRARVFLGSTPQPLPDEAATVVFSSGTTGSLKGLVITGDGVQHVTKESGSLWHVTDADRILVVLPMSSFQQRLLCYIAIIFGASICIVPPERMYQQMVALQPTVILGPPSFFELIPRVKDWRRIYGGAARLLLTGSAPVPIALLEHAATQQIPLYEVYGSTEIGWIAMNLPGQNRIGTAGRLVPNVEVRIADDGQVWARSTTNQAVGYLWEDTGAQAQTFVDGWVCTGDLGVLDDDGYLQLNGRMKNVLITSSGVKLNPAGLERRIEEHPDVVAAVVFISGAGQLTAVVFVDDAMGEFDAIEEHILRGADPTPEHSRVRAAVFRPASDLAPGSPLLTRNHKIDRLAVQRLLAEVEREDAP